MAKKLTTGERIRRYMDDHPTAKPRQIADALDVSIAYVNTLRSIDKKKIAEGKPIRRIKRPYTKKVAPAQTILEGIKPQESVTLSASQDTTPSVTLTSTKPVPKENFVDRRLKINDNVNHPAHYKVGGIETIEFIEAKKLGYNLGNVVKYITRSDHKGNTYEDLLKARWYLNREISKHLGVDNQ